jgi:hypothetical protein
MVAKKKQTQTFHYYNYGIKKNKPINFTTYCTYGSKKKNKPKPSIIVIMATTKKKRTHPNHLLYL